MTCKHYTPGSKVGAGRHRREGSKVCAACAGEERSAERIDRCGADAWGPDAAPPKWPVEDLRHYCTAARIVIGDQPDWFSRRYHRDYPLTDATADRVAIHLGEHPSAIWGAAWDAAVQCQAHREPVAA